MHTVLDSNHLKFFCVTLPILEMIISPPMTVGSSRLSKAASTKDRNLEAVGIEVALQAKESTQSRSVDVSSLRSSSSSSSRNPRIQYITLYSRCSQAYVELRGRHIDANGKLNENRAGSGLLRLETIGIDSHVKIQDPLSRKYICFDKRARIIIKHSGNGNLCLFRELISADHFTELQSAVNSSWFLGFKENGFPLDGFRRSSSGTKDGRRTKTRLEKCYQFMKNGTDFLNHQRNEDRIRFNEGSESHLTPHDKLFLAWIESQKHRHTVSNARYS